MRTLTVLPAPPASQGGATDRCAIALLLGLRGHGIDAAAIAPDLRGSWPGDAAELGVERVAVEAGGGITARLSHLRRPLGDLSRTALLDAVRDAARTSDLLHLEGSLTTWLDEGTLLPSVMSLHYRAGLDRSGLAPWRTEGRELLLFRGLERRAIRRHRWLVASSDGVASSITAERRDVDVTVVPLSLDPAAYPEAPLDGPPVAGMIGTAAWPPTLDALRRLLRDVWPAVRERMPSARLALAGRGMANVVRTDHTAGVEVLGEVASSQAFLRDLSVLLYPVGRGSGMKVKVLEAIACGVPVVTTAAGAEGLSASDGVVVCEDDGAMVDAVMGLLADPGERRERGVAARRLFLECYAPGPATEPLVALYRRILG
ncbi:MAG: polysaccharide biosynthesis protein PslH [Actinomycetota bacterium]|nr:polysaccharide biosynthesis protein PslH [Actinomycetota bacterium]